MSDSETETRLEEHRRNFRAAKYRGPLLRLDELTIDERSLINTDFIARCAGCAENLEQIYVMYVETLHSWGVMCPHPDSHRLYEGWQRTDTPVPFEDARWFRCAICAADVINR